MKRIGQTKRIGLVAGGGQFPLLFSHKARLQGYSVFAAAFRSETDPALADCVSAVEWLYLGQVSRLLRFFRKHEVTEAVMVGTIQKTRMFTDVRPDIKAIALVAGMRHTHDDGLLRAFAALMEREGVRILPSTLLLPELLVSEGCWTQRRPSASELDDVRIGWRIAKAVGALDIGQSIVVGGGSVLAVEAIDGTDATILRGGRLGAGNAVVVKVCKPEQDVRFDMPAVGARTIETMQESGARVLAVEAEKAVVFDREKMIELADRWGISVLGLRDHDYR